MMMRQITSMNLMLLLFAVADDENDVDDDDDDDADNIQLCIQFGIESFICFIPFVVLF